MVEEIKKNGGEAFFVKSDASKAADHEQLVKEAVKKYGKLNIAVNNAGIGGAVAPTGEYPVDSWQKVIDINLTGCSTGWDISFLKW